jgi:hypothetical protein
MKRYDRNGNQDHVGGAAKIPRDRNPKKVSTLPILISLWSKSPCKNQRSCESRP